jgi:beta-propeller repeat-containing protein
MKKFQLGVSSGCVCTSLILLTALGWIAARSKPQSVSETGYRSSRHTSADPRISAAYGRLPLHFEANHGQTDDQVEFLTRGPGYSMFLTPNEAVLVLSGSEARERNGRHLLAPTAEPRQPVSQTVLRMSFLGANQQPRVEGRKELPGKANYFRGKDPAKWRSNVPTYAQVQYLDVYPGIDLVYYGNQSELEYDFVVHPGADHTSITLGFGGADTMEVNDEGDLILQTTGGAIRQRRPFVYQEVNGERREIFGSYLLKDKHQVVFQVSDYDATLPLVIDPTLFYSSYLGGTGIDSLYDIAVDSSGYAFVTGGGSSIDFPTMSGLQPVLNGAYDAYVTKLDTTGSALIYSTYFGGSGNDGGSSIVVDSLDNAYVTGSTNSTDFPTLNALQPSNAGGLLDIFVTKLNPAGSALVYSTYLGGSSLDLVTGIALDLAGNAYVTGQTQSGNFPTTVGAFQAAFAGSSDAFVAKVNVTGTALVYSTYLGGTGAETGWGIAVDITSAYVTGRTESLNFPTTVGAFQTTTGAPQSGADAFVTKLDPTGSTLVYSTYLGGSEYDESYAIALDASGSAFVTGITQSTDFPTASPYQPFLVDSGGPGDAFVTKLNATGSGLVYSTYLGGNDVDQGSGIAVDTTDNAYVIGRTASTDFPIVAGAFQSLLAGDEDAFVTKLNPMGSALIYSMYLGGTDRDADSLAITLDDLAEPNAYVTGTTFSVDFPTTMGAFDTSFNGGFSDGFVVQISEVVLPPGPTTGRVTGQGTIDVTGGVGKFHLIVQRQTDGTVSGKVTYHNKVSNAMMKSETITSLVIVANTARIDGTCTINGMPCTFRVDVMDNGEPGTNDTFTISVTPGPTEGGTLQKGNILIQQ